MMYKEGGREGRREGERKGRKERQLLFFKKPGATQPGPGLESESVCECLFLEGDECRRSSIHSSPSKNKHQVCTRKGGREGWMEGGREGWMEGGRDGGMEGRIAVYGPTDDIFAVPYRGKIKIKSIREKRCGVKSLHSSFPLSLRVCVPLRFFLICPPSPCPKHMSNEEAV